VVTHQSRRARQVARRLVPVKLLEGTAHRRNRVRACIGVALALSPACTGDQRGDADFSAGPALASEVSRAASDSVRSDSLLRARADSINRVQPGYVVDSALPMDEQLRRFREGLPEPPRALRGGASSRERLVRRFVAALERADTGAIVRLGVTRAEYAWLILPTSPLLAPPYNHPPELAWFQLTAASGTGLTRLLDRRGGRVLGFVGHGCALAPERQGSNQIWPGCVVRRAGAGGDTVGERLFGPIVERDGVYKFLGFANQF
jgi:hypothetical protein